MNEIDELGQDAGNFAKQHPQDVKKGENKAEGMLGQHVGQQHAKDVVQGGNDLLQHEEGGNQNSGG